MVPHDHARPVARAAGREVRLDARRHGLHALHHGRRAAAHATSSSATTWPACSGRPRSSCPASAALIFGYVADRFGRTRALMATILIFSVASLGAATSQTVMQLLFWRALLGIGMGGEWASGAVLVSETWPAAPPQQGDQHHAVGMGARLHPRVDRRRQSSSARRRSAPTRGGGCSSSASLPALFTLWIRRYVREPETWTRKPQRHAAARIRSRSIFGPGLLAPHAAHHRARLRGAVRQLGPLLLAARVPRRGRSRRAAPAWASSARCRWMIPVQLGAYVGYLTFGFIADRIGRRRAFVLFMMAAAVLVPIYGQMARSPLVLLLLGPLHRLLRLRLLQHVRRLRRRALSRPPCAPPDRARATTSAAWPAPSRPTRSARSRRCPASASASRSRHVGVLPARRRADLHAARSQRPGARRLYG